MWCGASIMVDGSTMPGISTVDIMDCNSTQPYAPFRLSIQLKLSLVGTVAVDITVARSGDTARGTAGDAAGDAAGDTVDQDQYSQVPRPLPCHRYPHCCQNSV